MYYFCFGIDSVYRSVIIWFALLCICDYMLCHKQKNVAKIFKDIERCNNCIILKISKLFMRHVYGHTFYGQLQWLIDSLNFCEQKFNE